MRAAASTVVIRTRRTPTRPLGHELLCPPPLRRAVRRKLLAWYDRHGRDLPWRRRRHDPYAQWVAEIMLQQTRVDTVIGYYERFLRRFPTVRILAGAKREEVLKLWEGLGYYRRVLHLHRACVQLREGGYRIPETAAELRRLPGVGSYTAAAVASIAFGRTDAAVDGNVARVVARLFGVPEDVTSVSGRNEAQRLASLLLSRSRPGDFNQAWMDLGSSICTPRNPSCDRCPLRMHCVAFAENAVSDYPVRDAARLGRVREVRLLVGVFLYRDKMLVRRRPFEGIWPGLWEFPSLECPGGLASHVSALHRLAKEEGVILSGKPDRVAVMRHRLTHRLVRFEVYVVSVTRKSGAIGDEPRRWVNDRDLKRLSMPTGYRRVYERVKREAVNRTAIERSVHA